MQEYNLTPGTIKLIFALGSTWDVNFELKDIFGTAYPLAGKNITAVVEFEGQVMQILKVGNGITINGNVINLRKDNTVLTNGVYAPTFDQLIEGTYITRMMIEESGKDSCFAILVVEVVREPQEQDTGDVVVAPTFVTQMGPVVTITLKSIPDQLPDGSIETRHIKNKNVTKEKLSDELQDTISDYLLQNVTENNGKYINYLNNEITETTPSRKYVKIACGPNEKIKVTSSINGSPVYLVIFQDSSGGQISKFTNGVDGETKTYIDQEFTSPANTAFVVINGQIGFPLEYKKYTLLPKAAAKSDLEALKTRVSSSESAINSSNNRITTNETNITTLASRVTNTESQNATQNDILSDYLLQNVTENNGKYINYLNNEITETTPSRKYVKIACGPNEKIKVTSSINGSPVYLVIFQNSSGGQISKFTNGVDGETKTYTDQEFTSPANTAFVVLNGQIGFPLEYKKYTLLPKAAAKSDLEALKTRVSSSESAINSSNSRITTNETNISNIASRVTSTESQNATQNDILGDYVLQSITETTGKYINYLNQEITETTPSRKYVKIACGPNEKIKVTSSINGSPVYLVIFQNSSGGQISKFTNGVDGETKTYTDQEFTSPANTAFVVLNGQIGSPIIYKKYTLINKAAQKIDLDALSTRVSSNETSIASINSKIIYAELLKIINKWFGKTLLALGTSITEATGYIEGAALQLGAIAINKALGSSMMRISKADGSINDMAWQNYCYALCHTLAEKEYIISNWSTIRLQLISSNPPTTLSTEEQTKIRNASWELRLLPYLNGTLPKPDLIIIDHGRNDNLITDTESEYINIPSLRNDRSKFLGAFNYILDKIYSYQKDQKVLLLGHIENQDGNFYRVAIAQQTAATYWNIPIQKTWEVAGISQQIVPGSASLWSQVPWSNYSTNQDTTKDMTFKRYRLPDNIHPHTDTSGKTKKILEEILVQTLLNSTL